MTATLVARDVSAVHGARTVFAGASLTVAAGDVVGLVGANGAGKSTLLRVLAGLEPADTGTVDLAPPTATVGYLPQEPARRPGETITGFLARRTGVADAQAELDAATAELEHGGDGERYSTALERWLDLGGADLEDRVPEVAADLGLELTCRQTDTEGQMIGWVHEAADLGAGVVLNPAGWTHTSVALRDACAQLTAPLVEVHLTNVHAREPFRAHSYISPVAAAVVAGMGPEGYLAALRYLAGRLSTG